jgi:hypothetical protein
VLFRPETPEGTLNFLNSRDFVSKFKAQRYQANSSQKTIFYKVLLSSCVLLNIKLRLLKKEQKLGDKTSLETTDLRAQARKASKFDTDALVSFLLGSKYNARMIVRF